MASAEQGQIATTQQPTDTGDVGDAAQNPGGGYQMLFILAIWAFVFYFFFMRPQKKKDRERREMVDQVKKGDKVVTVGGIHGTVVGTGKDSITIKVCDKTGATLKLLRSAVSGVPSAEKEREEEEK